MSREGVDKSVMPRYLFIVAVDRPHLWDLWRRRFSEDPKIQVILDRRQRERRQPAQSNGLERRRADRRRQPGIDKEVRDSGFAIVGPISH